MEENQNPNPENAPVVDEESFVDKLFTSMVVKREAGIRTCLLSASAQTKTTTTRS